MFLDIVQMPKKLLLRVKNRSIRKDIMIMIILVTSVEGRYEGVRFVVVVAVVVVLDTGTT